MSDQLADIIERLEKLDINSTTPSTVPTRKTGPYDPPLLPTTLSTNITEICTRGEEDTTDHPTGKIISKLPQVELPKFGGHDFPLFVEKFGRFLRLSGLQSASDQVKSDWLAQAAEPQVYKITMKVLKDNENDLERSLRALGEIFPTLENDLTIRKKIESLQPLGYAPEPQVLAAFLLDFETLASKLSPGAWTDQDRLLSLISKINPRTFQEIRSHPTFRPRTDTFLEFKQVLQEKVKEDWVDRKLVTPKQLQVLSLDPQNQMQVDQAPQSSGSGPHNFQNRGRTKGQAPNIGKGKGKSTGRGNNSRNPSRNPPQNRFHATIVCKFCHKVGHYDDRCWVKYPHLKPTKRPPSRPPQQRNFQAKPKAQNQAPQIGFEPDEAQTNNKKRKINLLSTLVLSMGAKVNGKFVETIVDSGASASVVSANLVDPQRINRSQSVPVQVASGETIFTLGTTELELNLGGNTITQQALVLPTNAFQAVLGLDFLCTPPCQGLLTSPEPCRLLYDHREYPFEKDHVEKGHLRLLQNHKTILEDGKLHREPRNQSESPRDIER
jgi:hypothetical protein